MIWAAFRRAIETRDEDKTVALIGTGGLTHTLIDEKPDRTVLAALAGKDCAMGFAYWQ